MSLFNWSKEVPTAPDNLGGASIPFGSTYTTRTVKHLAGSDASATPAASDMGVDDTYTTSDLIYKCVEYIASTISQLKLDIKQESKDGNILEPIKDKKLQALFDNSPNDYQTWSELLYIDALATQLTGNSYLTFEKVKGKYEMWVITTPQKMQIQVDKVSGIVTGYKHGDLVEYSTDEIIHNKLPTLGNNYYGTSAIQALIDQLLLEGYGTQDLIKFYKNGLTGTSILTSEQPLTKNQSKELTDTLSKDFNISGKSRQSLIVLPNNLSIKPLRINPAEAQLLDSLTISEDRVLSAFKLHKMALGGKIDTYTHNINELLELQFSNAIRPRINMFVDKLQSFLRRVTNNQKLVIKVDYSNLPEIKLAKLVHQDTARNLYVSGLCSLNEARDILGLPSIDAMLANENHLPSYLIGTDLLTIQNITEESIQTIRDNLQAVNGNTNDIKNTDALGGKNTGKQDKV